MDFKNKVVVITGAAKGIGKSTAVEFAKENAVVILLDKDKNSGKKALEEVKKFSKNSMLIESDISDLESLEDVQKEIKSHFKEIDVLVANAGVITKPCGIDKANQDSISKTINTNFKGTYWTLERLGKLVKNNGSIVTISSIDGIIGEPFDTIYSGTKGAIISMTKASAKHYSNKGIRVNSIAPGLIDTPLTDSSGELPEETINGSLIKRIGKPEDIAKAVLFLSSEDASFITGQVLAVDGGFSLK